MIPLKSAIWRKLRRLLARLESNRPRATMSTRQSIRFEASSELMGAQSTPAALHESSLTLEDLQCFLQALDLCCPARFPLFVCLWLGNAPVLDFGKVLKHRGKFGTCGVPISREIADALVQTFMFLCLVFCILGFHCGCKLVVLGHLLKNRNGISLLHLLISQILCEITFNHLQN